MSVLSSGPTYEFPLYGSFSEKRYADNEKASAISDRKLWEEFRTGDEAAYASIYSEYADQLYSYGMKLIPHRERVMDAIQDLFVGMWESRGRLGNVSSIKAYLFVSLRRRIIATSNKQRKVLLTGEKDELFLSDTVPSSEQSFIEKEQMEKEYGALNKAIDSLNERQREIIYLKYYARMKYDDIAEVMEIDKKATYNLMARTMDRLKHLMGGVLAILLLFLLNVLKT